MPLTSTITSGNGVLVGTGLLYVGDLSGIVHCLDAANGAHLWKHETNDAIWGYFLLGDRFTLETLKDS
jgi:outer membrane protein assembly factor BamB